MLCPDRGLDQFGSSDRFRDQLEADRGLARDRFLLLSSGQLLLPAQAGRYADQFVDCANPQLRHDFTHILCDETHEIYDVGRVSHKISYVALDFASPRLPGRYPDGTHAS